MAASQRSPENSEQGRSGWDRRWLPFAGVAGFLLSIAILYLGYDFAKARFNPCESIFRQTATGLSTRIKFLKAEGELQIGQDVMAELSERAQMTAINLKTCCTVLDAGRLDPEQFLQCKSDARRFDRRVGEVAAAVEALPQAEKASNEAVKSEAQMAAPVREKVEAAIAASKDLNRHIVKVRNEQALQSLELKVPKHVEVEAKEQEPNNDPLSTNRIGLGKWIKGAVAAGGDADVFMFQSPLRHRDWMTVELENRSMTLEPLIALLNSEKSQVVQHYRTTQGANIKFSFVAPPGATYYARVSSYYGKNGGGYLLRVQENKSYDAFEPNDKILDSRALALAKPAKAAVMDGNDFDYYAVGVEENGKPLKVSLENLSQSLHPHVVIFDSNKVNVKSAYSTTPGADVDVSVTAKAGRYFIRVSDYYQKAAGDYRLTALAE